MSMDLRDAVATMLRRHGIPGCAIAAQRGDERLFLELGFADAQASRPVARATVFHLFSGTKLYTAGAILRLREQGQLELDAPVRTYLPELVLRHPITVRQLASHSSGLPDTLRAFMAVHLAGEPALTTAAALARYGTHRGERPGGKAAYRNVNYAILGELVSRVAGVPYAAFVERELLRPLGVAAAFDYTEASRALAAEGTIGRFSAMRWLLRAMTPGLSKQLERERHGSLIALNDFSLDTAAIGGLIGTAADFLPLAVELLSAEDGVLRADSKREMLTQQAPGRAGIASAVGVGLGWKRGEVDGVEFWNHEGGGAGFTSETRIYCAERVAVVVMMNATQRRKLSWLAHDICELVRAGR